MPITVAAFKTRFPPLTLSIFAVTLIWFAAVSVKVFVLLEIESGAFISILPASAPAESAAPVVTVTLAEVRAFAKSVALRTAYDAVD